MPGDDAFRFRHLLIRDAAYDSLPKETRAELHERFAAWLDEHVALVEQDEIVGYHLEQAVLYRRELGLDDHGAPDRASGRLGAAGRGAAARGDNGAAARLLERAATILPTGEPGRLELLPDLVLALLDLGRFEEARSFVDELAAAGEKRWHAYAWTLRPHVDALSGSGSFEESRDALAAGEEAFREVGDERGLALALVTQGHDEWTRCRALAAAEKYWSAIPHAERAGVSSLVDEAISNLCAIAAFGPTNVGVAEDEIRALMHRVTSVSAETGAYRALARLAAMRGDFEAARELVRRGREPLIDAGLVLFHAATSLSAAFIEEHARDDEEALRMYREGFAQLAELGEHAFASTVAAALARLLIRLGRDDEAEPWLAKARELCPAGDIATLAIADTAEGLLHAHRGRLEEGERLVRSGLEQAETSDFWEFRGQAYEALARVLSARRRGAEAHAAIEAAFAIYRSKGATVAEERARALLAEL